MLLFLIVAAVLIGLAYADYCLVDNTEHFGICFGKAMQAEQAEQVLQAEQAGELAQEAKRKAAELDSVAAARNVEEVPVADVAVDERVEDGVREKAGFRGRSFRPLDAPVPAWLLLDLEPVLELREESP